jgi:hypothetical protein
MNSRKKTAETINVRAKAAAATLGAGVVVTLGALTVALGNKEASASPPSTDGASPTTVQTTPPPTPVVKFAAPAVIAKAWQGKGWPGA